MKYVNLALIILILTACSGDKYQPKDGGLLMPPLYEEVPNGFKG